MSVIQLVGIERVFHLGDSVVHALDGLDAGTRLCWRRSRTESGRPRPAFNRRIALDVARGLAYLHAHRIVHMDVKSLNVLLAKDYTAKVSVVWGVHASARVGCPPSPPFSPHTLFPPSHPLHRSPTSALHRPWPATPWAR